MPIRIYALAKDLKIDSKELADLCVKAGIPGKGSALASLDDDEVVKLKAYLSGGTRKSGGKSADSVPVPPVILPPPVVVGVPPIAPPAVSIVPPVILTPPAAGPASGGAHAGLAAADSSSGMAATEEQAEAAAAAEADSGDAHATQPSENAEDGAVAAPAASGGASDVQGAEGQDVATGDIAVSASAGVGGGPATSASGSVAKVPGTVASTGGVAARGGASGPRSASIVPPIIPSARPVTPVGGGAAGGGLVTTVASSDSKSVATGAEKPGSAGQGGSTATPVVSASAAATEATSGKVGSTVVAASSVPTAGTASSGAVARSTQPTGAAATSGVGPGGAGVGNAGAGNTGTGGAATGGAGGPGAGRHGLGTRMGSGAPEARDTRPGAGRPGGPAAPPPASTIPPPAVSPMGQGRGAQPPSEPAPFTRSDYISPAGSPRGRILDVRTKRPAAEARTGGDAGTEAPKTPKKREPVININLPKMPEVKQPTPAPKAAEPKTQKPVIRLPTDAIRGARAGARPPLEHLTAKMEQQRKPRGPGERGPGDGGRPQPPLPTDSPAGKGGPPKGKKKHGADEIAEGPEAERGELAGMASSRADRQKARKVRQQERAVIAPEDDDDSASARRARRLVRRAGSGSTAAPRKGKVEVQVPCALRTFCELTGVSTGQVLKTLMQLGMPVNINASLTQDACELIAAELGLDISVEQQQSPEEELLKKIKTQVDDPSVLQPRPPVVTFLGHVDHGKTSLLDRIIGIDVVSGEAGGITQHIRAYEIAKNGRKIAFVDTPGHEAFTEMRARGANVTDIAVLVVAADDGVMPQTEEAINHAKAAGVPIVVALNKMDLPGANADRVLQQLAAQGLMPSEWSGDVEVVRCSALTGKGIDDLLETLLVTADLHEYKANPTRPALGVCLEAEQEPGRGVIAKVMVKNGTLSVGDIVVCGAAHGRVKAMFDTLNKDRRIKDAGPSTPVNLTGLDAPPQAGEAFYVLPDIAQARALAARRESQLRENAMAASSRVSFQHFQQMLADGRLGEKTEAVTLNLIIRADVRGSIEAIQKELAKFSHPEVQLKVLQVAVGGITVADVTLADASDAVILGFNVIPDEAAHSLAEQRQVEIRRYDIIYKVTDDMKAMIEGKLKPEERIVELGQAIVKQTFVISRVGTVAGCYVARGTIERNARIRVFRDGRNIGDYALDSLRREKDDVKEVSRGMECGIRLAGFNDVKKDDVLEAYKVEEVARTL